MEQFWQDWFYIKNRAFSASTVQQKHDLIFNNFSTFWDPNATFCVVPGAAFAPVCATGRSDILMAMLNRSLLYVYQASTCSVPQIDFSSYSGVVSGVEIEAITPSNGTVIAQNEAVLQINFTLARASNPNAVGAALGSVLGANPSFPFNLNNYDYGTPGNFVITYFSAYIPNWFYNITFTLP